MWATTIPLIYGPLISPPPPRQKESKGGRRRGRSLLFFSLRSWSDVRSVVAGLGASLFPSLFSWQIYERCVAGGGSGRKGEKGVLKSLRKEIPFLSPPLIP